VDDSFTQDTKENSSRDSSCSDFFGDSVRGNVSRLWRREHKHHASLATSGDSFHQQFQSDERERRDYRHNNGNAFERGDFGDDRRRSGGVYGDECNERDGHGAKRRGYGNNFDCYAAGYGDFRKQLHGERRGAYDCEFFADERTGRDKRDADGHEFYGGDERKVQRDDGDFFRNRRESHFHDGAKWGDERNDFRDHARGNGNFGEFVYGERGFGTGPDD
jgi:hypothetical protein